jgi:hypothetical protein
MSIRASPSLDSELTLNASLQDETHFQDLAEQAGLAVSEVGLRAAQAVQLDGYTDGQYQVLRLAWRDLPVPQ